MSCVRFFSLRIIITFLFLVVITGFDTANGQAIKRLTYNDVYDGQVSIYKNKIAWTNAHSSYTDIFLAENDTIKQLTYGSGYNYQPDIGSNYIVWLRTKELPENTLIYHDGFQEKVLDNGRLFSPKTVGKYIIWHKIVDKSVGYDTVNFYVFDGEKTVVFAQHTNKKMIDYRMQISESEILYLEKEAKSSRFIKYDYKKSTVLDSIQNGDFYQEFYNANSRKDNHAFLYYANYYPDTLKTKRLMFYNNGKLQQIPVEIHHTDSIVFGINEIIDDIIIVQERERHKYFNSSKLKFWKDHKIYTISEYPFTEINKYPELNNITCFFTIHDSGYRQKLFILQNNKITQLISGYFDYTGPWQLVYNKSIALAVSSWRHPNDNYEIYYYCGEDSCINAIPVREFKAKMYNKMQSKQIAVEIETPEAEKFNLIIYDLLGREIAATNFISLYGSFTFLFPTEFIKQGMYIVKLYNTSKPQQQITQKMFFAN